MNKPLLYESYLYSNLHQIVHYNDFAAFLGLEEDSVRSHIDYIIEDNHEYDKNINDQNIAKYTVMLVSYLCYQLNKEIINIEDPYYLFDIMSEFFKQFNLNYFTGFELGRIEEIMSEHLENPLAFKLKYS